MQKRLTLLVLLLVCGAIVNVAVAWTFAVLVPIRDDPRQFIDYAEPGLPGDYNAPGVCQLGLNSQTGLEFVCFGWITEQPSGWIGPMGIPVRAVPGWAKIPSAQERAASAGRRCSVGAGWPMLALKATYLERGDRQSQSTLQSHSDWGICLWRQQFNSQRLDAYLGAMPRILPLRPMFPEFVYNSLAFALLLWLPFGATHALMFRRRRIKRGLCPKCAYDLRGCLHATACPECGATVTSHSHET